jgi:hypothetical protein
MNINDEIKVNQRQVGFCFNFSNSKNRWEQINRSREQIIVEATANIAHVISKINEYYYPEI